MTKKILLTLLILTLIIFLFIYQLNRNDKQIDKPNIVNTSKGNSKELDDEKEKNYLKIDTKGTVDVAILFTNLIEENMDELIFEVYLNTHSVDLEKIDYANQAILRTNSGLEVKKDFTWILTGGSGHHIKGLLKIPNKINGNKILDKDSLYIELELLNIGGTSSKKFKWEVNKINELR